MENIRGLFRIPWVRAVLLGLFLALGLHPRPLAAETAYRRGLRLLAQQPEAALPDLLTAHRAWPARADIALQAAEAAWAAHRPALTVALLRHAAALAPLPAWAYARLSEAHLALNQAQAALADLQTGLHAYPHHPGLLQRLATLAQAQGEDALAIVALTDLVAQRPSASEARWRLALLLTAHDPPAALPHLEALAAHPTYGPAARALRDQLFFALRQPTPAQGFTIAGEALLSQGRPALAAAALRRAVALAPGEPTAWAYLGTALDALGDDSSLQVLRHAQRLAPRAALPNLLLGRYWLRHGNPIRALPWLQAAANADPRNPHLRLLLAQALAQTAHNLPRTLAALHRAVALAPHDAQLWQQAAQLALALNLPPEQTLPLARRAAALAPRDPSALTLLGQALLRAEDFLTAQRMLERALTQNPGYAPAHLYLGVALLRQHKTQAAQEHLSWAARLAPSDSFVARQARAWLGYP